MDQDIKDFAFFQGHFHPEREPQLMPFKGCPFCKSAIYKMINGKHHCFRCGQVWEDKTDCVGKESI